MLQTSKMYKVYSGKPECEECSPHLEAVFRREEEAISYVNTWVAFYPKRDVLFWYEKKN